MANLLSVIARRERERFFWRLDAEWGKGLRQKTKSDRCPDFRVVGRPPKMTQYQVDYRNDRFSDWEKLWSTEWVELAEAYKDTLRAEGFKARVYSREPMVLSANQSANITQLVAAFFQGCQAQTLIRRAATPIRAKVYRSTRLMGLQAQPIEPSLPMAPYKLDPETGKKVYLP